MLVSPSQGGNAASASTPLPPSLRGDAASASTPLPPSLRGDAPEGQGGVFRPSAMDKGARALVLLLAWALLVGTVVVVVQPVYRAAFLSMVHGEGDEASPLWRSNANYYDAVRADAP